MSLDIANTIEIETIALAEHIEQTRLSLLENLDPERKARLGQFFTPMPIAQFMASMPNMQSGEIDMLDAGSGIGSLVATSIISFCLRSPRPHTIRVSAYEIDTALIPYLKQTMEWCHRLALQAGIDFEGAIIEGDFIEHAVHILKGNLFAQEQQPSFNYALVNPPYGKIQMSSRPRQLLQQIGIETSNLYTGFLAAIMQLLRPGGEIVAITPRSFCNGSYFKPFRKTLLKTMSLRRIHIFESRKEAFSDADVLQENIILHACKSPQDRELVMITSGSGDIEGAMLSHDVPYHQVVQPGDSEHFIHIIPHAVGQQVQQIVGQLPSTLDALGLSVSTGRVVDFRARPFLCEQPTEKTAPLIYPRHLKQGTIVWPQPHARKPNAIVWSDQSQDLLVPNAHYVLVKRFTSKEEKKRIVAAFLHQDQLAGDWLGFENHLNYYHCHGKGLDLQLAKGLTLFLNSTLVDSYFRQFNGHTQVNAGDLRMLRYPSRLQLENLGAFLDGHQVPEQDTIDRYIREELLMGNQHGERFLGPHASSD